MPNDNTISRLVGGNTPIQGVNAIPSVVPTGTSAFIVLNQAATAAALQVGNSNAQPTGAQTYGSGFDGFAFRLRVTWKLKTTASCNFTMAIQLTASTATTYTVGNVIATTGAVANNSGSYNGLLEAVVLWDSNSAKLYGEYGGNVGAGTPALVTKAVLTNSVAVTAQSSLNFVLAATFSDTTAGTTLTVTEFVAEAV